MSARAITPILTLSALAIFNAVALAQSFDNTVDTKASSVNLDGAIVFDSSGTIIGDYDADTNPDGTQTRAGFFGGDGNNPIDTSVSMEADTLLNTNPAGSFASNIDLDLGLIEIDALALDLLNGNTGGTDLSVTMLYDSFHTVNPSFLYPGGIPFTIPFGQIGGINAAMLTQTAAGAGTITGTEIPDFYEFTALIPASLDMSINASLPGQDPTDTPIDALPIVLPAAGMIRVVGDGTIEMTMTLAPDPIALEIPVQDATLPAIPFELPTFGTETASVIYTAMPEMVTVDATLGLTIITQGLASGCLADFNGDGDLNFFDVSAFLGAFSAMDPAADLTGDGVFNFFDVSAFLAAYTQGCP